MTQAFRSGTDSIDAVWKCADGGFEPMAVAHYATVQDGNYQQGEDGVWVMDGMKEIEDFELELNKI